MSADCRKRHTPEAPRSTQEGQPLARATALAGLTLAALTADDTEASIALVDRSRAHLTQHGDDRELAQATPDALARELADPVGPTLRCGIRLHGHLIGRVDLIPRTPGHFVIGYWLGRDGTGHGDATEACRALVGDARDQLGATAIFAGVTKGNAASENVLHRLGFVPVADMETYTRFRRVVGCGETSGI